MKRGYFLRKLLDYIGVIALLGIIFFSWMFYHGPLSIPFLKPYIIEALNSEHTQYTVDIGEVNLELVRSIQPLKIIAKNVRIKKNDENISIKAPKLFLSFSMRALLNGLIAPSSIYIKNPTVSVFTTYGIQKNQQNEINLKKVQYYSEWFNTFLEHFNAPDKIYPESYINQILIDNAAVEFHEVDLGQKWVFSDMHMAFHRNITNLELSAGGAVDFGDRMSTLNAAMHFNPVQNKLSINVSFSDIVASDFIKEIGAGITNITVPLEGHIGTDINFAELTKDTENIAQNIEKAVESIDFSVKGSKGLIEFESDPHFQYNIDSFAFNGRITGGLDIIELKNAKLSIGNQNATLDFKAVGYKNYFLQKSLKNLRLSLNAKVDRLPMNDLSRFWPRYYAEAGWLWCKESLYGGFYQDADFDFEWAFNEQSETFELAKLKGKALIKNGTIYYLESMPIVTNVDGTAFFDVGVIDITLNKGTSDGLALNNGRVRLYDLNKDKNYIDIQITANSNIKDALEYIAHPPLDFGKDMGIQPNKFTGTAQIDLGLNFELYRDLKPQDIGVKVKAKLSNVVASDITDGKNFKIPSAILHVTNKNYTVNGEALYDNIPLSFDFKQNFDKQNTLSGTFKLRADYNVLKKLQIQNTLLEPPYLEGFADITAKLSAADEKQTLIDITANLENTSIDYDFLGFTKPLKEQGHIDATLSFKDKRFYAIPRFILSKENFSLKGKVSTDKHANIKTIDIESINGPKTSAAAKIDFTYQPAYKIKINITGTDYDLTELFTKREKQQKQHAKEIMENGDDDLKSVPNTEIFMTVNSLWTNPDTPIKNFEGNAVLKNGVGVEEAHLVGNYGTDKSVQLTLDYAPKANGEHYLSIDSNNAGSTLRVLRLYENMHGGILKIEAKRDANQNMIGHAKIRDFKIHNTPVLTKLLTVASFSGMIDLLKGDGLVFSHFDAPFTYRHKTLTINEARMFGNVLGLTADGTINRLTSSIDIKGIISPAYGLNSLMGKIPLVGQFLAGKDGTIFALDYDISGTFDEPDINIHPLSILSPNAVKELFKDNN